MIGIEVQYLMNTISLFHGRNDVSVIRVPFVRGDECGGNCDEVCEVRNMFASKNLYDFGNYVTFRNCRKSSQNPFFLAEIQHDGIGK